MNRKRAIFFLIPVLAMLTGYFFFFWRERLGFYGISGTLPIVLLTLLSLGMVICRPIPVKIRTICVLYLTVFGLLADTANLILAGPVWEVLYGSGLLVFAVSAVILIYGFLHGRTVVCKRYDIPISKPLPRPLRVGLLSDVHMGLCIDRQKLDLVCQALEEEQLDLLLLAGDLCDDYTSREDMQYALRRLGQISPSLGKFCVFGNHDLASHGPALQYTEAEYRQALSEGNIRILDDEAVITPDFILLGRRDHWMAERWGGRGPARKFLDHDTLKKPVLVLDHQPYDAKEAAQAGADLQLSGHTHAGQVWPASWLGRLSPTFYGLHWFGDMALVVSSGLGGRRNRLRSGCSPEYVIINICEKFP